MNKLIEFLKKFALDYLKKNPNIAIDYMIKHLKNNKAEVIKSANAKVNLPILNENDHIEYISSEKSQHFTQPPPRFTEASLVKKLEELGIGRPSTYANIVSVIQEKGYVKYEKKRFIPESKGRLVTSFLSGYFKQYIENNFTANLELQLDNISDGKNEWKHVLKEWWLPYKEAINSASS